MTKELFTQILAGVLASLIVFYLTHKYLSKPKPEAIQASQQTEAVVPNRLNQLPENSAKQAELPPLNERNQQPAEKLGAGKDYTLKTESQITKETTLENEKEPQQEADASEVEGQLQTMTKEVRAKQDSLPKNNNLNDAATTAQRKADAAYDELDNQSK